MVNFTANKLFVKVEGWVSEYLTADMVNKQMIDSYTKTQSGEAGKYALREMGLATRIGSAFLSLNQVFVNGLNSVAGELICWVLFVCLSPLLCC